VVVVMMMVVVVMILNALQPCGRAGLCKRRFGGLQPGEGIRNGLKQILVTGGGRE
jgi:hypothetical protein